MFRKFNGLTSKKPFFVNDRYSSPTKNIFFWTFLIAVVVLLILGFKFVNPDWNEFFSSFTSLGERIKELLNWDFQEFNSVPFPEIQPNSFLLLSLKSVWQTFVMTFAGTIMGTFLALPVAVLASKNIFHNKLINGSLKIILAVFRTTPAFVFSLLLVGIFGASNLTVTLAIMIFTFGMTAKIIYDGIEQINMAPYEVLAATGANKFTCFRAAAFPQVMKHIVSTWWYALEVNIRYSAIIGLVARVGIGAMIQNKIDSKQWAHAGWLLFLLIITIIVIELAAFVTKKWIMVDQDKILGQKKNQKLLKKVFWLNKLPNYFYWKKQIALAEWHQQKQALILQIQKTTEEHHKLELKGQLRILQKQKKVIWKTKIKTLRAKIKSDKLLFKNAQITKQKTYLFDEQLMQKIRLDKITKMHYKVAITNNKQAAIKSQQDLVQRYQQEFKNSLTPINVYEKQPWSWLKRIIFALVIFGFFTYTISQTKFELTTHAQIQDTWQHIKDMFNISWNSLFTTTGWNGNSLPFSVAYLVLEIIMIAIIGTFFGFICAFILGMLSSNKVTNNYIAKFFWIIGTIIRPIPSYIYAIILIALSGLTPFTGVLALAVATTGMLTKYIREAFNDIDTTILETLTASGANYLQRFRYGILPQVSSNIVSWGIYRFSINITEAGILGIVGAGNFGAILRFYWDGSYYHDFGALLFGVILTTVLLELLINVLRNKIKNGLDPQFIHKLKKLIRRYESPWYVVNGRLLGQDTASMSFNELKALFKYTNVIIFRKSLKTWIKGFYKLRKKANSSWKQIYADNYCQYFKLATDDSKTTMKKHHREYLQAVKNLINSRKHYLQKSAEDKVQKISSLKHEYQTNFQKIKTESKILKRKFNYELTEVKKIRKLLQENDHKLKVMMLKEKYQNLLEKNKNERRVLKHHFSNEVILAKSLWKSVKLRHE